LLETHQFLALTVAVTFAASAVIVSDELRRRALDARVLSALWFLEPGGNASVLHFLFGNSSAMADVRAALRRLERAGFVSTNDADRDRSYAVTAAGLYSLERGGLGLRGLYDGAPTR